MVCETAAVQDYYAILGISESADTNEVKRAYYRQAKLWHPDKNASDETAERFKLIQKAYEVLSDASERRLYDLNKSTSSVKSSMFHHPGNGQQQRRKTADFDSMDDRFPPDFCFDGHHQRHQRFHQQQHTRWHSYDPFSMFYDRSFFDNDYFFRDASARFDAFVNYIRLRFYTPFSPHLFFNQYRSNSRQTPSQSNGFFRSHGTCTSNTQPKEPPTSNPGKTNYPLFSQFFKYPRQTRRIYRNRRPRSTYGSRSSSSLLLHMCRFCGMHSIKLNDIIVHEQQCSFNPDVIKKANQDKTTEIPVHVNSTTNANKANNSDGQSTDVHVKQVQVNLSRPEKFTCRVNVPVTSTINIVVN